MATFRIRAAPGDQICTLVLEGEADLDVEPDIVAFGTASLSQFDIHTLCVDLAKVTFIDSTAIGVLVLLRNTATDIGKHLVLSNVPTRVRKVMAITGLDAVFGVAAIWICDHDRPRRSHNEN
jgi:anti-anti-sigma factor